MSINTFGYDTAPERKPSATQDLRRRRGSDETASFAERSHSRAALPQLVLRTKSASTTPASSISEAAFTPIGDPSDAEYGHVTKHPIRKPSEIVSSVVPIRTGDELERLEGVDGEKLTSGQWEQRRFIAWCFDNMLRLVRETKVYDFSLGIFRVTLNLRRNGEDIGSTLYREAGDHIAAVQRYLRIRWRAEWSNEEIATMYLELWEWQGRPKSKDESSLKQMQSRDSKNARQAGGSFRTKLDDDVRDLVFPPAILNALSNTMSTRTRSNPAMLIMEIQRQNLWNIVEREMDLMLSAQAKTELEERSTGEPLQSKNTVKGDRNESGDQGSNDRGGGRGVVGSANEHQDKIQADMPSRKIQSKSDNAKGGENDNDGEPEQTRIDPEGDVESPRATRRGRSPTKSILKRLGCCTIL